MRFFCLQRDGRHEIRLSFSYVKPEDISAGVERLASFVRRVGEETGCLG